MHETLLNYICTDCVCCYQAMQLPPSYLPKQSSYAVCGRSVRLFFAFWMCVIKKILNSLSEVISARNLPSDFCETEGNKCKY
jgi:hypothetical protein